MVSKRVLILSALLFMAISLGIIALVSFKASAKEEINLVLPGSSEHILYSYAWIAQKQGFFDEEGLKVNLQVLDEAKDFNVMQLLYSDKNYPIGIISVDSYLERQEYVDSFVPFMFFMYGADDTSSYDTHLIASKKSGITDIAQLKGKQVRLGKPPTYIAMERMLAEHNLSMNDIGISNEDAHLVLEKFRSGELDAAITYYPTMPVFLASGEVNILKKDVLSSYVLAEVPQSCIGIRGDFLSSQPETARKFLRAMEKAVHHAQDDPAQLILAFAEITSGDAPRWQLTDEEVRKGAALIPHIPIEQLDDIEIIEGEEVSVFELLKQYHTILNENDYAPDALDFTRMMEKYELFMSD